MEDNFGDTLRQTKTITGSGRVENWLKTDKKRPS